MTNPVILLVNEWFWYIQSRPRLTKALFEDALDELTDPSLGTNYDGVDMRRLIACAAAAVRTTARSRPRMSQVR